MTGLLAVIGYAIIAAAALVAISGCIASAVWALSCARCHLRIRRLCPRHSAIQPRQWVRDNRCGCMFARAPLTLRPCGIHRADPEQHLFLLRLELEMPELSRQVRRRLSGPVRR